MSVTIADIEFDRVEYDADADVLYLHVGDPPVPSITTRRRRDTRSASTATGISSG